MNSVTKWLIYIDSSLIDSSQNINPKFILPTNGIYKIKLITTANDTFERFVLKESNLVSFHDTVLCDKDSFLLTSNNNYHCVNWQDTINSNNLWVYKSGTYKVTGIDGNNNFITDSISVHFLQTPRPNLGNDTAFCSNTTFILKADSGLNYIWNTEDTTQFLTVIAKGLYTLKESNNSCYSIDSINIDIYPIPKPTISKLSNSLSVNPAYTNFQWYKNQQPITGAKANQYIAPTAGNYFVIVMDSNGCSGSSDTVGLNIGIQLTEKEAIKIYPNPVQDILIINSQENIHWQLLDITGETILTGNAQAIDLKDLTNTTFILNIQTPNSIHNFKIIKQ